MTLSPPTDGKLMETAVLQGIRERAAAADRGEATLAADLSALHAAGMLAAVVGHTSVGGDTLAGARLLRRIGRVSLPVGRIVEGHANALRLIGLYGSHGQRRQAADATALGAVFGVWGAEGKEPVVIAGTSGAQVTLRGAKHFCSGLGLLTHAVVPVQTGDGPQLLLADVRDPARADASVWQVSGMRATASGRYDLTGVAAQRLGSPGDYLREPHFEGGIWRYCALHCGGLEALAEAVRQHILARGQGGDSDQTGRLAQLVILCHGARLWVEAAALAVESGRNVAAAVAQGLLAREAVEQACLSGMALAERALGTAAFGASGEADRVRRDLAFFLRQANLDGKRAAAVRHLLADPAMIGDMW
ncbi:hypothetical protein RNZ50_12030 [Paracoccaceae bacterium Fryx2]|nr:hypothetical protein [Paracoccaceae bacterium Fryx2]